MAVFGRVDHAANAVAAQMKLRPTQLLIFGSPKAGTVLMQESQLIGIDLPLKALAWEDEAGQVWLTAVDPAWLANRHGLGAGTGAAVSAMAAVVTALIAAAAGQ